MRFWEYGHQLDILQFGKARYICLVILMHSNLSVQCLMKKFILISLFLFAVAFNSYAQKGFENSISIHFGAYDKSGGGGVEYIGGYRFNEIIFLGGNIGIGAGSFEYSYVGAHMKVYFSKSLVSPYLGLTTGVLGQLKFDSFNPVKCVVGLTPLISPSIGMCERTADKFGVYMSVSCDLTGKFITSTEPYRSIYFAPRINLGIQF